MGRKQGNPIVVLSHETALAFWRWWSIEHCVSVRDFHGRSISRTDDLPFRVFASTSVLSKATNSKRILEAVLCQALGTNDGEALRKTLATTLFFQTEQANDVCSEVALGSVHLVGPRTPGARGGKGIVYHHSSASYPKESFLRVAERLYVCSPELVFVQMAETTSFGALLALGYELCGCYPIAEAAHCVRHPLCTPARLLAYASQLTGARGVRLARTVARYVLAKSASPAETCLAAIVASPRRYGGFGVSGVELNMPVALNSAAQRIGRTEMIVCDAIWPEHRVVMEYDSDAFHEEATRLSKDAQRRSALSASGYTVKSITSGQLADVLGFQETVRQAFLKPGAHLQRFDAKQLERHMHFRNQLQRWHDIG